MAFLDGLFPAGFFTGEFYLSKQLFLDGICRTSLKRVNFQKLYFPAPAMQYILHFD
jgi:hypothetical protein